MRTCIKSRTSSNFGQIGPLTTVSCPWVSKKFSRRLTMGKWCLHASSFIFDGIIIKVAGNQDRRKSSVKFDFWSNQTTHFGVTCPWVTKISGRIRLLTLEFQNSGVHGNRKPPLTYNGENGVSTFSMLLLIRSFLYLQVTRTCIKSRAGSNFSQIRPLTTKLAALELLKDFQ